MCVRLGERYVLAFGDQGAFLGQPAFGAPTYVRLAFQFVLTTDQLFPHTVVDDRGQHITGPAVLPWILDQAYAFPRADVLGVNEQAHARACVMKELDLELQRTYAARSPEEFPGAHVDLAVDVADHGDGWAIAPHERLAPRLARAIPLYRLHPATLGALSAALLGHVLHTGRRDLRISLDDLDEYLADREE